MIISQLFVFLPIHFLEEDLLGSCLIVSVPMKWTNILLRSQIIYASKVSPGCVVLADHIDLWP